MRMPVLIVCFLLLLSAPARGETASPWQNGPWPTTTDDFTFNAQVPYIPAYRECRSSNDCLQYNRSSIMPACVSGLCYYHPANGTVAERSDSKFCVSPADCAVAVDKCGHAIAVNKMNFETTQTRLASEQQSGCDWVEDRPVQQVLCQNRRCTVLMDNHPQQ